jgi:hypothetical protein
VQFLDRVGLPHTSKGANDRRESLAVKRSVQRFAAGT